MKVNNHKYVKSYFVEKLECGVVVLNITCNQNELYFHRYNDTSYLVCGSEEEYNEDGWGSEFMFETLNFLNRKEEGVFIYVCTENKEDNVISFYFIPYKRDYNKTRKIIVE